MFHDVDESLRVFLRQRLPERVNISFEAPSAGRDPGTAAESRRGASKRDKPTVTLYLHEIREDLGGRGAGIRDIRNADEKVIGRTLPMRRYQMIYLVTAEATTAEKSHELLGQALMAFISCDTLPPSCLQGYFRGSPARMEIRAAEDISPGIKDDLWSAFGLAPRASFALTVLAPLVPEERYEVAPLVTSLALDSADSSTEEQRQQVPETKTSRTFTSVHLRSKGMPGGKG
ncbi:DUF4255 domain-containing protein [Streptomyces sp. NPDC055085]